MRPEFDLRLNEVLETVYRATLSRYDVIKHLTAPVRAQPWREAFTSL